MTGPMQFMGLLLILLAANVPYWDKALWPDRDTVNVFQVFYTFYNNWFLHGEFTRWFPYGNCGIQADYWQLFNLTPAAYFMGFLGRVFRIQNVLWLFKGSILIEQIMMLYGMFLLGGKLFKHAATRFWACLAMIFSTVWLLQVYWNFRIYYLLPLMLYLLVRWLETTRFRDLCLAGVVGVFSLVGNIAYFGALYALLLVFFAGAFSGCVRPRWRALLHLRWPDGLWLGLFILLAGLYLYVAAHMLDHIHSCSDGRDSGTGPVALGRYLADGSGIGWQKFSELVFPVPGQDFTLYIGFLPLVLIGYALVRSRVRWFAAFLIPGLFVAFLSVGDALPFAAWTYRFFLPMRWFHYIGQLGGLLRFFLIVCAGFGLDQVWSDREQGAAGSPPGGPKTLLVLLTGALIAVGYGCHSRFQTMSPPAWSQMYPFLWTLAGLGGLGLALVPPEFRKTVGWGASLLLVLDLGAYQFHVIQSWPCRWPALDPAAARVRPYSFQAQRGAEPRPGTAASTAQRAVESHPTQRCAIEANQFIQYDSGWSRRYLNLFWAEGLHRLLESRAGLTLQWRGGAVDYFLKLSELETAAMGWGWHAPKIRLITDATYAPDAAAAIHLTGSVDIDHAPVVETDPPQSAGSGRQGMSNEFGGPVEVVSYTYNHLEATARVTFPGGAWLYYADAFHPGWKATVNDAPAPVIRANAAFKAIWLDEGEHRVRLVYSDGLRGVASRGVALASLLFTVSLVLGGILSVFRGIVACRAPGRTSLPRS